MTVRGLVAIGVSIRVLLMNGRVNLQEWQHLLVVVWYCVPELPLQGLSRVTASVINVMVRCWEMPQPIGGSNGGAWGQSWRFICGRPTTLLCANM